LNTILANLPNLITVGRIILTPVLVIFLISGRTTAALVVFLAAGISDGLDGFIARLMRNKTRFGEIADPLADKLLLDTTYVTLAVYSILPAWLAVVVLSRDLVIIIGIAVLAIFDRPVEIKPLVSSKITTFLQISTIVIFLGNDIFTFSNVTKHWFIVLTAAFTLISWAQYTGIGFKILARLNGGEPPAGPGQGH